MSIKEFKLEVTKRDGSGKKSSKQVRREGGIPGVYYSHDSKESVSFSIDEKELFEAQKSGANIFNISVGAKKRNVIFKSVQYHPVTDDILHIDLYGVKMDEKITVKVSIHLTGDATGVKDEGGVLNSPTSEIEVACLPMDIPNAIEVDVTKLSIGDSMQVFDIKLDDKLTLMSSPDAVVASVTHAMREEEPVVEEEGEDLFMDEEGGEAATTDEVASGDAGESTDSE
jgi:large subunit ribosomal protein L25